MLLISSCLTTLKAEESDEQKGLSDTVSTQLALQFCRGEDMSVLATVEMGLEIDPSDEYLRDLKADLIGRKKKGTFGKPPTAVVSANLRELVRAKETRTIIDSLDEVFVEQAGYPGGVPLHEDARIAALIMIGDDAVPSLIDCIEHDRRFTRSSHCWRIGIACSLMRVKDAALTALMSILRIQAFDAASTGDSFGRRSQEQARQLASHLRAYWKKFGSLDFDDRMMAMLRDHTLSAEMHQSAATNLANPGQNVSLGTTVFTERWSGTTTDDLLRTMHRKYQQPTIAEAILAALDSDTKSLKSSEVGSWRQIEHWHVMCKALRHLADQRIGPALANCIPLAPATERLTVIHTAAVLGAPQAFESLCREAQAGTLNVKFQQERQQDGIDFEELVVTLASATSSSATQAFQAFGKTDHPYAARIKEGILNRRFQYENYWPRQPYVLSLFKSDLKDTTPSGYYFMKVGNEVRRVSVKDSSEWHTTRLNSFTDKPRSIFDEGKAVERRCDIVAEVLSDLVWTLPLTHPLLKNNEEQWQRLLKQVNSYAYRPMTSDEQAHALHDDGYVGRAEALIPDLPALKRCATAGDVVAGKAMFSIADESPQLSSIKVPALGFWRGEGKKRCAVIIVQAETGRKGVTLCGILFKGGTAVVTLQELEEITPLKL